MHTFCDLLELERRATSRRLAAKVLVENALAKIFPKGSVQRARLYALKGAHVEQLIAHGGARICGVHRGLWSVKLVGGNKVHHPQRRRKV
jgi:hypothetical protein